MLVVVLWALPRALLPWLGEHNTLLMAADLLWLPLCIWYLAKPIVVTRQWRNLFFVPLLVVLTLLNAASWLWQAQWADMEHLLITTVLLFTTLIAVMGGRVIPFFTARATGMEKSRPYSLAGAGFLATLWLTLVSWLLLPTPWATSLCLPLYIVAAVLHLWRQLRWRLPSTLGQPLLWSLHLAYLFIPLGLLALGALAAGLPISLSLASHLLSAGCMGTMILGMIARVSLGHSGRALQVGRRIQCAFALVIMAALIRVLIPLLWPAYTLHGWNLSGLAWSLAYGLFVWVYAPILSSPGLMGAQADPGVKICWPDSGSDCGRWQGPHPDCDNHGAVGREAHRLPCVKERHPLNQHFHLAADNDDMFGHPGSWGSDSR